MSDVQAFQPVNPDIKSPVTLQNMGEYLFTTVPVGSVVSVTTNTPVDVCTLVVSAGKWDVSAVVDRSLSGVTATRYAAGISLTVNAMPTQPGGSGLGPDASVTQFATFGTTVTGSYATPVPPVRVEVPVATTLHLVVADLFSAGTVGAFGTIRATRVSS